MMADARKAAGKMEEMERKEKEKMEGKGKEKVEGKGKEKVDFPGAEGQGEEKTSEHIPEGHGKGQSEIKSEPEPEGQGHQPEAETNPPSEPKEKEVKPCEQEPKPEPAPAAPRSPHSLKEKCSNLLKKGKKYIMLSLSTMGVAVEVVSALVEFHVIFKHVRPGIVPMVTIGVSSGGLAMSYFNYKAVGWFEGAKFKNICLCMARTDPLNGYGDHPWGSAFHMLAVIFWSIHLVLTFADAISMWFWHHELEHVGFSVYPLVLSMVEFIHACLAFSSCFDRKYYIECKKGREGIFIPAMHRLESGCVIIECRSCEDGWCGKPGKIDVFYTSIRKILRLESTPAAKDSTSATRDSTSDPATTTGASTPGTTSATRDSTSDPATTTGASTSGTAAGDFNV